MKGLKMFTRRTLAFAAVLSMALPSARLVSQSAAAGPPAAAARGAAAGAALPDRLSDQEFWSLGQSFSEPGGTFHSDNFVSNEGRFQTVIPDLIARAKQNGFYVGVGPEQNFTYMAALHPRMAFILDIRRGNLQEHLLYKALFEMSADRVEFISRLFSRPRPAGVTAASTVDAIFAAVDRERSTDALYRQNLAAVLDWLTMHHGWRLSQEDRQGIDYIYRSGFFADGPELGYQLTGQGRTPIHPSYADLMVMKDPSGHQSSYLASEANFAYLKDLEAKNLLVPVVGDFGGPKALRAIGRYARTHGTTVSAFYLSNVEQYLEQDGKSEAFCASVASMPLDAASTFIRSRPNGRGLAGPLLPAGVGMFWSVLGSMTRETASCSSGHGAGHLTVY